LEDEPAKIDKRGSWGRIKKRRSKKAAPDISEKSNVFVPY